MYKITTFSISILSVLIMVCVCAGEPTNMPNNDGDFNMQDERNIEKFNKLFDTANKRIEGIIFIGAYNPKNKLGLIARQKLKKPIKDYKTCLSMVKDHWQSMVFIAMAYQSLGEHKDSLMWLEKAMEIETHNHVLPKEASLEAIHLNDIDKAIEYSNEALKRKQNDPELLGNHAMNLLIAHKDTEARSTIEKALAIDPNDSFNQRIQKIIENVIAGIRKRPTCESVSVF